MKQLPAITTMLDLSALPSVFGPLDTLVSKVRYRDLIVETSPENDGKFYSLTIVTQELALDLFGSGFKLIFFPAADSTAGESEFDVSFEYRWGILRYVPEFDFSSFAGTGKAFFHIFLELVDITEAQFLAGIVEVFIDDPTPYQALVDKLKQWQGGGAPLAGLTLANQPAGFTEIEYIIEQVAAADVDVFESAFEAVVEDLNDIEGSIDRLVALFRKWLGEITVDEIKELLIPQVSASIDAMPIGIQFPSSILREVDAEGKPVKDPNHPNEDKPAMLSFNLASLKYSTAEGLEFNLADSLDIDFPRSEILSSGLILELHEVKVDFSRTTNIPEAIADGRPEDFVGVYVKNGTITFPAFWNQDSNSSGVIKARNLLIGTGGFSGTLALESVIQGHPSPVVQFTFGDKFSVSLDAFSITLKQNTIKESEIKGTLIIPGFMDAANQPAKIEIDVAIRQNGDFDITAKEKHGLVFKCGGVFELTLKSAYLGKKDDDFYLGVSGSIKFTQNLLSGLAPIEVEKLLIWSDGRFEIEGGTIPLPKNIRFPIGPAQLSISAIHMGSHQQINSNGSIRNFRYFGFDGGVDVNPGGIDVRGKGIKFFYPVDLEPSACYLEIKSIAIDLVIPGSASKESATVLISGYLSIGGTPADPEYEGGIKFALPKAKIAGGASMKLRPKVPAFIVDAFVELSTPILLGNTSLGIFGFRGLFGQRYVATKAAAGLPDTATWFDYYKVPQPTQGVNPSKFEGPSQTKSYDGAFSIGAGVTLATAYDDGYTISLRLFLMLSLPDLIYLEGKAKILGERIGFDGEDPPFFAVLAISSKSVETGVGVNYKIPNDDSHPGWIVDLNAEMRAAFFFQNSAAWYVNFGTVQNPTTARVLSLFDATSYVMLSAAGIVAGAGVTFGFNKSYAGGMVHASVGCYIKVNGFISFERPQIGGFAMIGGHVDVSLMWFSFYLVIDTSLSVEAPKPFYVQGSVHLCVGVTIGFWKFKKEIEKCFDVEFKWEKEKAVDTAGVLPFADLSNPNIPLPVMGTNMLSGESFKIANLGTALPSANDSGFDSAVLPLDTWVDIEFLKGLLPQPDVDARIGRLSGQVPANTIDYIPPAEVAHKVKHEYSIKRMEIRAWSGSAWVDYRTYEAMSPPAALATINANPAAYKDGFWQNSGSGFNKLRLLAETSLSYMEQGEPGWYIPEQFGITSATLFCRTRLREKHCLRWTEVELATVYAAEAWRQTETVFFRVSGGPGTVLDWNNHFSINRSLAFANESTAEIVFNQPCVEVNLKLTTFSSGAVIRFYKRETAGAGFVFTQVESRSLTQAQLLATVQYNDPAQPVVKVVISPVKADAAAVLTLQKQIDALYRQLYETRLDDKQKGALLERIKRLEQELELVRGRGCTPQGITKEGLAEQATILKGQVEECPKQLGQLQAEQQQVCKEAADLREQFEHCFPHVPSSLSYEVVEQMDPAGRLQFKFNLYNDERDEDLLNGAQLHPDAISAERAAFDTLKLTVWPGNYALMVPKDGHHFFQLVDTSGRFVAVTPAVFNTWSELVTACEETVAICRKAQADREFVFARRLGGRLTCDDSLEHLICWQQLPTLGAAGAGKCNSIVAGILKARETFCNEYNRLYRELYICNKQLLSELMISCETITRELEIKSADCITLSNQLAALAELQSFIDQSGPLVPPKESPCTTLVHEVCCLSLEDYQFNLSAPEQAAIDQDYQNAIDGIEKRLTPIWRPDTKYIVRLQVTDTVNDVPSPSNDRDFYFGFRTAGPVGHFHEDALAHYVASGKKPDQYLLTSLKGYIDYRRSYPDPSGQLIGAKPLFYEDARSLLFFTKRYVYHFFGDWPAYNGLPALTGNAMQIIIKDPAEDTSIPNPPPPDITTTKIPQGIASWPPDDDPRIPEDIRALLNLHNPELLNPDFQGGDCWSSGAKMIKPASVFTSVEPKYLKPLKLYTTVVNNIYAGQIREVHQYVFQTSRYPDFTAQVKSYRLDDGKGNSRDAVFQIELPLTVADLDLMLDVVSGNMSAANSALAGDWADPFDRLVAGVMKLPPLNTAMGTEFNIVSNSTTSAVVAVWIRNPEPFNDPKLPSDVLERSLRVMDGANIDLSYKVLFSKDGAQAFVMHPAKVIPVTQMQFRFAYIEWDGNDYVDRTIVISAPIPTTI